MYASLNIKEYVGLLGLRTHTCTYNPKLSQGILRHGT